MSDCILKAFSNPSLEGPLLGLGIHKGELTIDKEMFPCCAAKGERLTNDNKIVHCELKWRFSQVRKLFVQYYKLWGDKFPLLPQKLNRKDNSKLLENLYSKYFSVGHSGTISRTGSSTVPSELWPMALASTWRFGVSCHFISLGKTKHTDLLPAVEVEKQRSGQPRKKAIFVGNVNKLSDPSVAFDLETIVGYAYRSNYFLFLELVGNNTSVKKPGASMSTKGYFSRKISALKAKSPREFLQADCLSRLESMCGALDI